MYKYSKVSLIIQIRSMTKLKIDQELITEAATEGVL